MESKGQQERNYHRPKRTYWVEESQEWGLLDYEPEEEVEPTVHWVGRPEHRQRGAGWCGTQSDEEAGRRESAEGDGLPAVQDEPVQEDGQEGRGGDRRGGRDYFATQLDSAGWRRGEVKCLDENQKAALFNEAANTVEMVEEAMADVESMCMMNSKVPVDLVEMCCPPDSSLAQMVLDLGGTAVRISERNMNLSTRAGLEQALDFVRKEKPRWLWASFPCGPTSQVQSLNELTPEAKEKSLMRKKKSRRLVRRGLQVFRVHVFENGGQFAWEWPQSNQGWWFPEVQHFLKDVHQKTELYNTILHGCQVGVRADDGGFSEPDLPREPCSLSLPRREQHSSLCLLHREDGEDHCPPGSGE